jgi:hypothetical protein
MLTPTAGAERMSVGWSGLLVIKIYCFASVAEVEVVENQAKFCW